MVQGLEDLDINGWLETIQTTARIMTRVQETCCPSKSVRNHQLMLVWKTHEREKKITRWVKIWHYFGIVWNNSAVPDAFFTGIVRFFWFDPMGWIPSSKSTVFGQLDFAWFWRFLQPELNFFNHLITVLWSSALLPPAQ